MATQNRYKYWGNWGLPLRGAFGATTIVSVVNIGRLIGKVIVKQWRANLSLKKWVGRVKRYGD